MRNLGARLRGMADAWLTKTPERFLRFTMPKAQRLSQEPADCYQRAQLLTQHGFIEAAGIELQGLIARDVAVPGVESSVLYSQCGTLYEGLKRYDLAAGLYRQSMECDGSPLLSMALARAEFAQGNFGAAQAVMTNMLVDSYNLPECFTRNYWLSVIRASAQVTRGMGVDPRDYAQVASPVFGKMHIDLLKAARARQRALATPECVFEIGDMYVRDAVKRLESQGAHVLAGVYLAPMCNLALARIEKRQSAGELGGAVMLDLQSLGMAWEHFASAALHLGDFSQGWKLVNGAVTTELNLGKAVVHELETLADEDPHMDPDRSIYSMSEGWQSREQVALGMSERTRRMRAALAQLMQVQDVGAALLPESSPVFGMGPMELLANEHRASARTYARNGHWHAALQSTLMYTRFTASAQEWEPALVQTLTRYWEMRTGQRGVGELLLPKPTS